jgi:hypothetical protein
MNEKKVKKKLLKEEKYNLKFIIEDFLGKDKNELEKKLKKRPEQAEKLWNELDKILSQGFHHLEELDDEDKQGIDFIKLTLALHQLLKPVLLSLQKELFDFKFKILPGRSSSRKFISDIKSGKIDKSEPWYEYRELVNQESPIEREQFFDIVFDTKIVQVISFESGHIKFYNNPAQQILNFLELFKNVPISLFSKCAYEKCGKLIVLTRKNKSYCTGTNCAAKKHQYEKWKKDREGMKIKENIRYHAKRKK